MIRNILVKAPAKINLHLGVGDRRPDGFHDIASVFQAVSMYDTISLSLREGEGIRFDGECGCPVEKNTVFRAAKAFLEEAARNGLDSVPGLTIALRKGVPMGAGLGGGSSDAASTLAGLSSLLPGYVDDATLFGIAASIGSDVPFFMGSACAAVTGRGEVLSPLSSRTDYTLIIVDPGFSISTKDAYRLLDETRAVAGRSGGRSPEELGVSLKRAVSEYAALPPSRWSFENDFFEALAPAYPGLSRCRAALIAAGADYAAMSGSGSAIYGVFEASDAARHALEAVSAEYRAVIAFPLALIRDSI